MTNLVWICKKSGQIVLYLEIFSFKTFRAEILQIFELVIWKIDDFINSFWLYLTLNHPHSCLSMLFFWMASFKSCRIHVTMGIKYFMKTINFIRCFLIYLKHRLFEFVVAYNDIILTPWMVTSGIFIAVNFPLVSIRGVHTIRFYAARNRNCLSLKLKDIW